MFTIPHGNFFQTLFFSSAVVVIIQRSKLSKSDKSDKAEKVENPEKVEKPEVKTDKDGTDENKSETDSEKLSESEDEASKIAKEVIKRTETLEKIPEEDEPKEIVKNVVRDKEDSLLEQFTFTTAGGFGTIDDQDYFPTKGIEVEEFISSVKDTNEKMRVIQNSIMTVTGNEAILLEINKVSLASADPLQKPKAECKNQEEIYDEAVSNIEKIFKYKPIEFEGMEEPEPEEEEGQEEEEVEDEENEEEEGDLSAKEAKVQFGETSHYCPVSLHTKFMLIPGSPEMQCKYREKIYRFYSEAARQSFMDNPDKYLSLKRPLKVIELYQSRRINIVYPS